MGEKKLKLKKLNRKKQNRNLISITG